MILTWSNVDGVIKDCLLNDATDASILQDLADRGLLTNVAEIQDHADMLGIVVVQTAMQYMAFNKERLEAHRTSVMEMIQDLPDEFINTKGGGRSLMNLVMRKDGNQWGEQWNADLFFGLAKGLGLADFCIADREVWASMPGGMPYIYFKESV